MTNSQPINRNQLTYRQSTSAIILDENKLLLIVQKASYKDNEWDIPGGGVEEGETPEQTILRELEEELGCDKFKIIKTVEQIDKYDWTDETITQRLLEKGKIYRGQQRIQFFVHFFGDKAEIKIQPDEIRVIKWIPLNELEKYFIFPNQLNKIKQTLASQTI